MARPGLSEETRVEGVEGCLARLGNALVYLELVSVRVSAAMQLDQETASLMEPAVRDCRAAATLIRGAQASIRDQWLGV